MKIRLLVPERGELSTRFLTNNRFYGHNGWRFYLNDESGEEDIIFVLESLDYKFQKPAHCPVVYLCAETSFSRPFVYGKVNEAYIQQFDVAVTPYDLLLPGHIRDFPFIPPMLDVSHGEKFFKDREWLVKLPIINCDYVDTERVAIICSSKSYSYGHRKRLAFIKRLVDQEPSLFVWYGEGVNRFERKVDILSRFRYVLVIENDLSDWIVSEKVLDPLFYGNDIFYAGSGLLSKIYPDRVIDLKITDVSIALSLIKRTIRARETEPIKRERCSELKRRSSLVARDFIIGRIERLAKSILSQRSLVSRDLSQDEYIYPRQAIVSRAIDKSSMVKRACLNLFGAPSSTRLHQIRNGLQIFQTYFYY